MGVEKLRLMTLTHHSSPNAFRKLIMDRNKQIFGVGLLFGIVITALFCLVFAPRYMVSNSDGVMVKLDRWSGETWRFASGNWAKIDKSEQDWKEIDKALASALNLKDQTPKEEAHTANLITMLKEKYPVLAGVPNDDIMSRINIVYSRFILTDMYLDNIEKIHEKKSNK